MSAWQELTQNWTRLERRLHAEQMVAKVDWIVLHDIADGWRTSGEPRELVAAARKELMNRYACLDCGAEAGRTCKPDYGCEWKMRRPEIKLSHEHDFRSGARCSICGESVYPA